MQSPVTTLVTVTGNEHVRVSDLRGQAIRFRGIIEPTFIGVRTTRREWPQARQARAYRQRLLARLSQLRAVAQ